MVAPTVFFLIFIIYYLLSKKIHQTIFYKLKMNGVGAVSPPPDCEQSEQ